MVRVDAITWFGTMSYNRLRVGRSVGWDAIFCPVCGGEIEKSGWYILEWVGLGPPPPSEFGSVEESPGNGFRVIARFYA